MKSLPCVTVRRIIFRGERKKVSSFVVKSNFFGLKRPPSFGRLTYTAVKLQSLNYTSCSNSLGSCNVLEKSAKYSGSLGGRTGINVCSLFILSYAIKK